MPQQKPYRRYPSTLQKNLRTAQKPHRLRLVALIILGLVVLLIPVIWITATKDNKDATNTNQQAAPSFDKTQFSLDDPTSPWVVVNKTRPLSPKTYTPASLRAPNINLKGGKTAESMQLQAETATALEALATAAQNDGLTMMLVSGYRSHNSQKTIYDSEVRGFGQAVADQESARPGHSEHQTGWAADLVGDSGDCEIEACFAETPEGQWLAANAYKYGFVIRYAKDKTDITGYVYEPWHIRYVGVDLATEMHRSGIQTLEEFFNLPPAPTY
jgi:D-alanyl-D-alanine carboxypeptidase